jgi:hypothetical protein
MKEKTSIAPLRDVQAIVERIAGWIRSRSAQIERALRFYFWQKSRSKLHVRDLKRINASADRLNLDAEDVLSYQASND